MSKPGGDCCCKASAYMYGSMYVCRHIILHYTYTYIYAYMYMYTHTHICSYMNELRRAYKLLETNIDADSHLPSVASKKHFRPTWAKNHMRHKSSGKKHANPPLEAWICELCFVGSHVFCWTLAHETNHNNIGETRNKPASQIPSFGCVLAKSPSMNDHCCPSRSTASWEEKVEVPNLGKISLVVDVVGLFLRTMSMCKYKHEYIYIYYYMKCVYIYISYAYVQLM